MELKPFLLRENIRNTANIYKWTAEKTRLGTDVIANPVEGPTPQTELISDHRQLIHYLEVLFRRYLEDEQLSNTYNAGGATYNNFDTTIDLGVTADQIESPLNARNTTMAYAGRLQGGDFKWTFDNSVEDANDAVIPELKSAVMGYTSKLVSVQGIE